MLELRPAKISDRFIAYILDAAPFACGYILHRVPLLWLGLYFFYQFLGNLLGATIGKRLMGLQVLRRDGQPLGVFRALLRALGYGLSTPFFNFGFVVAFFQPESRTLHDMISGSLVVEARAKNQGEAGLLFLAAALLITALFGGTIYLYKTNPTLSDILAVEKARDGLKILARIEEEYKRSHGAYTSSLSDLAQASGDVEEFKAAMSKIFDPNLFQIQAGNRGYRLSAAAKDRRKTRVTLAGP
ncbi:MAG: RDD family protein [Elusimicrobia bacterium]|nr:RDD family protein [Elusimicrobiota bacterium]